MAEWRAHSGQLYLLPSRKSCYIRTSVHELAGAGVRTKEERTKKGLVDNNNNRIIIIIGNRSDQDLEKF